MKKTNHTIPIAILTALAIFMTTAARVEARLAFIVADMLNEHHKIPSIAFTNQSSNQITISRILYFNDRSGNDERKIGIDFPAAPPYSLKQNSANRLFYFNHTDSKGVTSFRNEKKSLNNFYYKLSFVTGFAKVDTWKGTSLILSECLIPERKFMVDLDLESPQMMFRAAAIEFTKDEWTSITRLRRGHKGKSIEYVKQVVFYQKKYASDPSAKLELVNTRVSMLIDDAKNGQTRKERRELSRLMQEQRTLKYNGGRSFSYLDAIFIPSKSPTDEAFQELAGKNLILTCTNEGSSEVNCTIKDQTGLQN